MKYDSIAVGKRIAEIRKQLGYSQEAFAEELFVTRSLLSKIEIGIRNPTISMLVDIADIAGVTMDYLIRGTLDGLVARIDSFHLHSPFHNMISTYPYCNSHSPMRQGYGHRLSDQNEQSKKTDYGLRPAKPHHSPANTAAP